MKPELQRIKIAEACEWKQVFPDTPWRWLAPDGRIHENWGGELSCPDYLNDLNAMAEAEEILTEAQLILYEHHMVRQARHAKGIADHESHYPVPFVLRATAAQRAEAFLRTLNLWEPETP